MQELVRCGSISCLDFILFFFVLGMRVSKENHFKPGIKLNHLHNYR